MIKVYSLNNIMVEMDELQIDNDEPMGVIDDDNMMISPLIEQMFINLKENENTEKDLALAKSRIILLENQIESNIESEYIIITYF